MDTVSEAESGHPILKFDVVIVGGGMVGMTIAAALAQQTSLSIAILEAHPDVSPVLPDQYHHRVSAIALSSVRIFESLSVWQNICAARVSPFQSIQVWDGGGNAELNFTSNDIGETILGYIIENNVMQHALAAAIHKLPQIKLIAPVKLTALHTQEDGVTLIADDHTQYQAKLAVAADGARSWLRERAGIRMTTQEYEQEAIVASVVTEQSHAKSARQVFLPTGPLAFLPLQDAHTSSIVWSLPNDEAKRLAACDAAIFQDELARAFGGRLGAVQHIGPRFTFPLKKQQAEQYITNRIALAGDAAHVMHPLAGQGVNLGLLDAASLAEVITGAALNGEDIGVSAVLRRYERWRRADNLALLTGVDLIKQLFASDKTVIQAARTLGLVLTSRLAMLKNIFTRYAVGCREDLPKLAKARMTSPG